MGKNALVSAQELFDQGDIAAAYQICLDYFEFEEDTWDFLSVEDEEKLKMLKLNCAISTVRLEGFSGGHDSNNRSVVNPEQQEIWDLIDEIIAEISVHIVGYDGDKKALFDSRFSEICKMAQELFYSDLDLYFGILTIDATKSTGNKRLTAYYQGYCCLMQQIMMTSFAMATIAGVSLETMYNTRFDETSRVFRDKYYEKALQFIEVIVGETTDFPYYDREDIGQWYYQVDYLLGNSINTDKDSPTVYIGRMKRRINNACDMLNAIIVMEGHRVSALPLEDVREKTYNNILSMETEIRKYEPNYSHPPVNAELLSTIPQGGGCYVATAVYGSYDCPEVWTLRRYRDDTLAKTWYGRAFIRTYYAVSPTLVKWFGHTEWFKKMWHGKLDRMVAKLQANGVESTPYKDKHW